MNHIFRQIILGDENIHNFDYTDENIRISHLIFVAILFLNNARFNFQIGVIEKEEINDLLQTYSKFINENQVINSYIESKYINPSLMEDNKYYEAINHQIIKLIHDFKNPSIEEDDVKVKGFVEPSLLAIITLLSSILFLCNLYLNI